MTDHFEHFMFFQSCLLTFELLFSSITDYFQPVCFISKNKSKNKSVSRKINRFYSSRAISEMGMAAGPYIKLKAKIKIISQ